MRVANHTSRISTYTTWYEFKKDLEQQLGFSLPNWRWLEVKPKAPLPWNGSHMQVALSTVARFGREQAAAKRNREN